MKRKLSKAKASHKIVELFKVKIPLRNDSESSSSKNNNSDF